jgi:hypothetical protein
VLSGCCSQAEEHLVRDVASLKPTSIEVSGVVASEVEPTALAPPGSMQGARTASLEWNPGSQ